MRQSTRYYSSYQGNTGSAEVGSGGIPAGLALNIRGVPPLTRWLYFGQLSAVAHVDLTGSEKCGLPVCSPWSYLSRISVFMHSANIAIPLRWDPLCPERGLSCWYGCSLVVVSEPRFQECQMFEIARLVEKVDHIGAWKIDIQSQEVSWSRGMHAIQGTDARSFAPNLEVMRRFYPRLAEYLFAWALKPEACEAQHVNFTATLIRGDGLTTAVVVSASPRVRHGSLQQVSGFVNYVNARDPERALVIEAEQRYLMLFQYAPHCLIQAGVDKRILLVNPAVCRLLDYSPDELYEMTTEDITHPDDRVRSAEAVRMLWEGQLEHCSYDKRYLRRDGSAVWVRLGVSLLRDTGGKPLNFIGQCLEITEQQAKTLDHQEDRLRSLQSENERLLASAGIDTLTKLANRASFESALKRARSELSNPGGYGIIFVEVRSLHLLNRNHGTETVDDLLVQVARILSRNSYTDLPAVARLNGGSFRILVSCRDELELETLVQEVQQSLTAIRWSRSKITPKVRGELLEPLNLTPQLSVGTSLAHWPVAPDNS